MMNSDKSRKFLASSLHQMAKTHSHLALVGADFLLENPGGRLFSRNRSRFPEVLIPYGDHFELYIGFTRVALADKQLVDLLPKDYLAQPESSRGSLLAMLMFTQVKEGKGSLQIDRDALASTAGS
jgi:hypothetical protein